MGIQHHFTYDPPPVFPKGGFGKTSAEFNYRLDGGAWQKSNRERPDWCGADGWYRTFQVADDLTPGQHSFELEVVHGVSDLNTVLPGNYAGTNFNLALIGVIP